LVLGESEREQRRDETVEIGRVTTNRTDTHVVVACHLTAAR
jgi:hypothetical protein